VDQIESLYFWELPGGNLNRQQEKKRGFTTAASKQPTFSMEHRLLLVNFLIVLAAQYNHN
jgi:hypothetical protein